MVDDGMGEGGVWSVGGAGGLVLRGTWWLERRGKGGRGIRVWGPEAACLQDTNLDGLSYHR